MLERNWPVVAGAGMTPFGRALDRSLADLAAEAVGRALADAKLGLDEVQAVFAGNSAAGIVTGQESIRGQVALKGAGVRAIPVVNVENACATGSTAIHMADAYIRAGFAELVLVVGYEKMHHADKLVPLKALEGCSDVVELESLKDELGLDPSRSVFMDIYVRKVRKSMVGGALQRRHFAMVAAKNHCNGALNPYAQFRKPLTVDDVLAARMIVDPLSLMMCSPISDGAAAVVLCSPAFARSRGLVGPRLAGTAISMDRVDEGPSQMRAVACTSYARAEVTAADVDLAEVHDATAPGEIFAYEDLGLAEEGQGWRLLDDGATSLGGRTPVNPSGGLLARGHPIGATGVAQICELTWQMRGEAEGRQVKRARVGVAHTAGGSAAIAAPHGGAALSVAVLRS
jgi:acetyl-CoA acyltransferase